MFVVLRPTWRMRVTAKDDLVSAQNDEGVNESPSHFGRTQNNVDAKA